MRCALFAAVLVGLTGCAEEKLEDVTGTITYDGAHVPAGVVWFDPEPNHPGNPPQGYAYIKDGKFNSVEKGRGVKPGAYLIRVEAFDGKPGNEQPLGKPLFTDYQEKRELPAGKVDLEIKVPKQEPRNPKAAQPEKAPAKNEKGSKAPGK
ncbi:MAG: hypothetical protein K8U57_40695 [Planctomycetes bacterium]|nr:hypothetical protein [Planctomycetota bacterium]